jgi:hypothetical protein
MHSTTFVNITSHSQYRKMFFYFLSYLFKFEDRNIFLFPLLFGNAGSHEERPVQLQKDYTRCLWIKDCMYAKPASKISEYWELEHMPTNTTARLQGRSTASLPPVCPSVPASQPHRSAPPPPPTSATAAAHLRACSTLVSRRHRCRHRAPSPLQLGIPYFATSLGSLLLIHFFIVTSSNLTWFFCIISKFGAMLIASLWYVQS